MCRAKVSPGSGSHLLETPVNIAGDWVLCSSSWSRNLAQAGCAQLAVPSLRRSILDSQQGHSHSRCGHSLPVTLFFSIGNYSGTTKNRKVIFYDRKVKIIFSDSTMANCQKYFAETENICCKRLLVCRGVGAASQLIVVSRC